MSKVILICFRKSESVPSDLRVGMEILNERLTPENMLPRPLHMMNRDQIYIGLFNPSDHGSIHEASIKLGVFYGSSTNWWEPFAPLPDGSYCLFRSNRDYIEIASDVVGTRTIWYVLNEDVFLASTSQRALIFFLKSFKFNESVIPWLLSSGGLGPGLAWDRRIQCLGGNERLVFDRQRWSAIIHSLPCHFKPKNASPKIFQSELKHEIRSTFKDLNLDSKRWAIALSGGYDSRSLLILLKDRPGMNCLTWGSLPMLKKPGSDAYIARKLSTHFRIPNRFFDINASAEDEWKVFQRFISVGEGRIDHIRWYMDGFSTWMLINQKEYQDIIRGDEGFGWKSVKSPSEVYKSLGVIEFSQLFNTKQMNQYQLEDPIWPRLLRQKTGETLAAWRDRLYQCYRIPTILASLTDLKLPFVNIINPLLSRRIITYVRTIPDYLRTDKRLFKDIVSSWSPPITFAYEKPIPEYFPREQTLYKRVIERLDETNYLSPNLKRSIRFRLPLPFDQNKIVLRSFILTNMTRLLAEDASAWSKAKVSI